MCNKKNRYTKILFFVLLVAAALTSCEQYIVYHVLVKNKTSGILNIDNLHLTDTLGIVEPFTSVYITIDPDNWLVPAYLNYKVFDGNSVLRNYKHYRQGEFQLNSLMKENYQTYLTCFPNKVVVKMSLEDSLLIDKQIEPIKQLLKDNLIKQLPMSDSLYNCLLKYGYKQYLITDVLDYYYAEFVEPNVHSCYRLFIFDMITKSLSFYSYSLNADDGPVALLVPNNVKYCYLRSSEKARIKGYNQKIKRAYKKSLKSKNNNVR